MVESRRLRKAAAVLMTAVIVFVAVTRGETFCLCDDDPDGCGSACHECGAPMTDGLSDGEWCLHLELALVDLAPTDGDVPVPAVYGMPTAVTPHVVAAHAERFAVLRETSPPPWHHSYCSYSIRLYPRS